MERIGADVNKPFTEAIMNRIVHIHEILMDGDVYMRERYGLRIRESRCAR
jgi:hypothetical protein